MQLALFDLDGTVVDSSRELVIAYSRIFDRAGLPPRSEEWISSRSSRTADHVLLENGARMDQLEALVSGFRADLLEWIGDHSVVFSDAKSALETLHGWGIPCAIVTNRPQALAEALLGRLGLLGYFQVVQGLDGLEPKPSPQIVRRTIQRFPAANPEDCVMIGDSHLDVEAGHAAGVATVAVVRGDGVDPRITAARPDLVVCNLMEWVNSEVAFRDT